MEVFCQIIYKCISTEDENTFPSTGTHIRKLIYLAFDGDCSLLILKGTQE